jgi:DNA-binding XRE family transcriptional regulator
MNTLSDDERADDVEAPEDAAVDAALQRFGKRLRQARERAGMTQADAARAAGTTQGSWSKLENGQLDPTLGLVLRIVGLFRLDSIEALFGPAATGALMGGGPPDG